MFVRVRVNYTPADKPQSQNQDQSVKQKNLSQIPMSKTLSLS